MSRRIVFVGAGAGGGYIGGHIARQGEDVTLIDPWPEHIEYIKHNGIQLSGTQGEHSIRVNALHLHEVQSLARTPVDIAFICTKSYDTEWATMLIKQYMEKGKSHAGLHHPWRTSGHPGWGRTVGHWHSRRKDRRHCGTRHVDGYGGAGH